MEPQLVLTAVNGKWNDFMLLNICSHHSISSDNLDFFFLSKTTVFNGTFVSTQKTNKLYYKVE